MSDHGTFLAQAERLLMIWADLALRREGIRATLDTDGNDRWVIETYEPRTEEHRRWQAERRTMLLSEAQVEAMRAELAALGEAENLLKGMSPRLAEILEERGVDSTPLHRLALTLDPRHAGEVLLAIRRAAARNRGDSPPPPPDDKPPERPTRAHCLFGTNGIRWRGEVYVEQRFWHLLGYILDRVNAKQAPPLGEITISFDDVEQHVYKGDRSPKTIMNDVCRLNNHLLDTGFPWGVQTKSAHITIKPNGP
jgi:hypothetical protein